MKIDFNTAFNVFKNYISENIPELGNFITHWEEPFTVIKNQTVLLPDSSSEQGNEIKLSIRLCISILEKNLDAIPQTQTMLVNKIFIAANSSELPSPIIDASVASVDYYNPVPQAPLVGVIDAVINLTVEYIDDCN